MKKTLRNILTLILALTLILGLPALATTTRTVNASSGKGIEWYLKYSEEFNKIPEEPTEWVRDDYTEQDDIYYGENGILIEKLFNTVGGADAVSQFKKDLGSFTSFRRSYTLGENDWLTVEAYGRGENGAAAPVTGGKIVQDDSQAKLVCENMTDAILIRSTNPLPQTYRIEVRVTAVDVGGKQIIDGKEVTDATQDAWTYDGKMNGYDEKTAMELKAGPWRPNGDKWNPDDPYATAYDQNGAYFASIVDYPVKPHNNILIHHHRKVAMDTDNNTDFEYETWSEIWNGEKYEKDGSRYISMLWMNGNERNVDKLETHDYLNYLQTGQKFFSFQPNKSGAPTPNVDEVKMVDKFIPGNPYVFVIERTPEYYKMSVQGVFRHGGETTYEYTKNHLPEPENLDTITWHFNQTLEELNGFTPPSDTMKINEAGETIETWPKDAVYPDYFLIGIPHINYYAGSITYDYVRLYTPDK